MDITQNDLLAAVRQQAEQERLASQELARVVAEARAHGVAWRPLAAALNVTHQSAMSRFRQAVSA